MPFQGDEFQPHMITVGNRVLLRCSRHPFLSYCELCHLISSSFECRMLAGTGVHRTDDDFLLAFALLLNGVHELFDCPSRNISISVGNFSSKIECPKGWYIALLVVLIELPVGRSDFALKENGLRRADVCAVKQCPSVVVIGLERFWHLVDTGRWEWKDECI